MLNTARIETLKGLEHPYFTNNPTEIEYLLGKIVSKGELIVGQGAAAFFVDSRYSGGCRDLTCVTLHDRTREERDAFLDKLGPKKLYIEPTALSLSEYRALKKYRLEELSPVEKMRMIKDREELGLIRESAKLNQQSYNHLMQVLKEGMTEKEAAWEFEKFARENGAEGMAFGPTVAFGEGSSVPHYMTGEVKLQKGMPVLIDVGVIKNRYMSDMTRSFLFQGENREYEEMLQLVKEAQRAAVKMAKPGVPVRDLDILVRNKFEEAGKVEAFKHTLGHGLGLEIHESPLISHLSDPDLKLEAGMAVTVEPGLYFDGKWGIRHEDTIIIQEEGAENLYENEDGTGTR